MTETTAFQALGRSPTLSDVGLDTGADDSSVLDHDRQSPSFWKRTQRTLQDVDDEGNDNDNEDSVHPMDSKDSNGSATSLVTHHPVSKESPMGHPDTATAARFTDPGQSLRQEASRAPWHFLASPKSSVHALATGRATSSRASGDVPVVRDRFQPSPTTLGWPQRSPIKPEHEQEVASFALFTQSFDTLSETERHFLQASPETIKIKQPHHTHHYHHHHHRHRANSHASPNPKKYDQYRHDDNRDHDHHHDSQPPRKIDFGNRESEMRDISPIKLNEQRPPQIHRRQPRSSNSTSQPQQQHQPYQQQQPYQQYARPSPYSASRGGLETPARLDPPGMNYPTRAPQQQPPYHKPEEWKSVHPRHPPGTSYNTNGYSSTASNPFYVLRSVCKAFETCSYKLPCLYEGEICPVKLNHHTASIRRYHREGSPAAAADVPMNAAAAAADVVELACRRVASAIHAFGGYAMPQPFHPQSSIFRDRKMPAKQYYDNRFHRRYSVAGNHISWEFEEDPPVSSNADDRGLYCADRRGARKAGQDGSDGSDHLLEGGVSPHSNGSVVPVDSQQKMRYRCKLCGQLKQNHDCPYQQSLQRSIAVMVYPAVNAFTASEPGVLTKPISEMNNFVSYDDSEHHHHHHDTHTMAQGVSPDHPIVTMTSETNRLSHVAPEVVKTTRLLHHSPESSLSTHSEVVDPSPHRTVGRKRTHVKISADITTPPLIPMAAAQKTTVAATPTTFLTSTLTLRPEHFRAVTPRKPKGTASLSSSTDGASEDYQYPHVPLTFGERKRLSDTLFFLSQEIPTLMSPIAPLLRLAREQDEWDLAVSELLTQTVVALYCAEGDHRLDGLQGYLLEIGISC